MASSAEVSTAILVVVSNVARPALFNVPSISVLPDALVTLNVCTDPLVMVKNLPFVSRVISSWNTESPSTSKSELKVTLLSTSNVLLNVTPESTSRVPSVWVLPLSVSTSKTLAPAAVCISNFLLSALIITLSVIVVSS